MHDVVRDVGISIASKDHNPILVKDGVNVWPDKDDYKCCRAISLRTSYYVRRLPDQLDCRGLRTFVLESTHNSTLLELPNCFFERMEELEVLILKKMKLVPSSLSNLVSLRMLCLNHCELVNLSFLKELKNLEILIIGYIYESKEMVLEIGQLTHLRLLDFRGFHNDIRLSPGFLSLLSDLEELYILEVYHEWEVEGNASIVDINSLTCLTALDICIPKDVFLLLPKDLPSFKSLTKYEIWTGSNFSWFYRQFTETKILGLEGIPLMVALDIVMANAEVLCLINLEGLKKVFHDREGEWFLDLKYLQVEECDDLEHLLGKPKWSSQTHGPCPLGSFGNLRVLKVKNCRSMKYLFSPSTARGLPKLQKLEIRYCVALEEIIGGDEEVMDKVIFHQLKKMQLEDLPNLVSIYANTKKTSTTECNVPSTIKPALFNEKVMFPVLENLNIFGLNSFKAKWDKQLLPVLEGGDSFKHLQELKVSNCERMEEILSFGVGQGEEVGANDEIQLKTIELEILQNLKSFCCSHCSEEEETSNEDIALLQALVNHKVRFPSLEILNVFDCT